MYSVLPISTVDFVFGSMMFKTTYGSLRLPTSKFFKCLPKQSE